MSQIFVTYDVATQSFGYEFKYHSSDYCDVYARVKSSGVIKFEEFSFGYEMTREREIVASNSWPHAGEKFIESGEACLAVDRLLWKADWELNLKVWLKNFDRHAESTHSLAVPRPDQPFPSWVWGDNEWVAPEPYPDPNKPYYWVEGAGWMDVT